MKKYSLGIYVGGIIVVFLFINSIAWSLEGEVKLKSFKLLSSSFLLGLLAMYIAMQLYRWK